MSELPDGWEWRSLGELLLGNGDRDKLQQGWSPRCETYPAADDHWGVLKTTAVQAGWFDDTQNKQLPGHLAPRPTLEVCVGDLLITSAGPRSRCGVPTLVRSTRSRLMLSGKFYRFRVTEDVESAFLEAWLLSPDAQNDIDGMKTGISESGLNLTQARFLDLRVPLPPLDEQRGIVAILEDHLAHLDVAGSRLSRASSQVDTLVTNILLDLIPDARDYPSDWTMSTVGQAGKVELGRQRHPDWHVGPNMHPYLRVANVFEDRLDLSDVMQMHWPEGSFERFRLKPGDILLNEGQSPQFLGRPAIYQGDPPDIAFTNSLLRFQANENVLPEFALLVFRRQMRAGRFSSESRITTNIAHLSAGRLKVVEFPIPPLREQRRLVRRAGELLYGAERLSDHFTTINQYQTALRRSLLATAFRGDLISGSISRNK